MRYLVLSILNIHVGMAGPEQVSMHIYGNVVDQGCDVATKSALQNIHIGDFNISDFQAANTVSTAAEFEYRYHRLCRWYYWRGRPF